MAVQVTDATILVNNQAVAVIPNTVVFDEGLGEQSMRAASLGGGRVTMVYSHDVASNVGMVKFSIPATVNNINLAKAWKVNRDQNVVQVLGSTPEGTVTRTFTQAALLSKYEVPLGTDKDIEIVFNSAPPI